MSFHVRLWPTLFSILGLALLVLLGSWQLSRYLDAQDFEERRDARMDASVAQLESPDDLESDGYDFRRVEVQGTWDTERLFLIKNRVFEGTPGYWIVTPLHIEEDGHEKALLVNRGWIHREGGPAKAKDYLEALDDEPDTVVGLVHLLDEVVIDNRTHQKLDIEANPTGVVELNFYDTTAMNRVIEADTFSRPIVITESPGADSADEEPIPSHDHITAPYLTAETHFGYMLTWYLLALALIGIWIAYGFGILQSQSYKEPAQSDR